LNIADLLVTLLLLAGSYWRAAQLRSNWDDQRYWQLRPLEPWRSLLGYALARAADRAMAAQAIILVSGTVLMASATASSGLRGGAAAHVANVGSGIGVLGILIGTVIALMIILLNRPRIMVPPPCRLDHGILAGGRA
jgi:hypothetical protein